MISQFSNIAKEQASKFDSKNEACYAFTTTNIEQTLKKSKLSKFKVQKQFSIEFEEEKCAQLKVDSLNPRKTLKTVSEGEVMKPKPTLRILTPDTRACESMGPSFGAFGKSFAFESFCSELGPLGQKRRLLKDWYRSDLSQIQSHVNGASHLHEDGAYNACAQADKNLYEEEELRISDDEEELLVTDSEGEEELKVTDSSDSESESEEELRVSDSEDEVSQRTPLLNFI